MKAGRKASAIPRVRFDIWLREDIAAMVKLLQTDPLRGKVKYGERSMLIESLLIKWIQERRGQSQGAVAVDTFKLAMAIGLLESIETAINEPELTAALKLLREARGESTTETIAQPAA